VHRKQRSCLRRRRVRTDGITSQSAQVDLWQLVFQSMVIAISIIGTLANVSVIYVLCVSKELKKHAINVLFVNQLSLDLFSCVWLVITYSLKNVNAHLDGTYKCPYVCEAAQTSKYDTPGWNSRILAVFDRHVRALVGRTLRIESESRNDRRRKIRENCSSSVAQEQFPPVDDVPGSHRSMGDWRHLQFSPSFLTSISANGVCIWGVLWSSNMSKSTYAVAMFIIFFVLIFVSFLFCYGHIIRTLRQQSRIFAVQHANNPLAKANDMQALRDRNERRENNDHCLGSVCRLLAAL
jgi:hypothetical protein